MKRLVALFLVLLLSIESFAALVGDNDGAAFITKAEFDSLKNTFQAEINRYNNALDNKVDGAIAGYLAGINVRKKREQKLLLNNYSVIRWAPNWKVYGSKKSYSDMTTYTETTNEWFTPPHEQRAIMRHQEIIIFNYMHWGIGEMVTTMHCTIVGCDDGAMTSVGAYIGDPNYYNSCPTFMVSGIWDETNNGWRIANNTNPYINYFANLQQIETAAHRDGQPGYADYTVANRDAVRVADPSNFTLLEEQNGYIIRYSWDYEHKNGTNDYNYGVTTAQSFIKAEYANFPSNYHNQEPFNDSGYTKNSLAVYNGCNDPNPPPFSFGNLFSKGVTWVKLNNDANNRNRMIWQGFNYMMLGADNTDKCLIYSTMPRDAHPAYPKLYTDNTKFASFDCRIRQFSMSNPRFPWKNNDTSYQDTDIPVTLKCPLWPEVKIADLYNPNFVVNEKPLKFGQGIPLIKNASAKGDLQVSVTVQTRKLLDDSKANNKFYLDLKKSDYLNNTDDYIDAYEGMIDTEKTSESTSKIKRKAYTKTNTGDTIVELTMTVNAGDDVWLRLSPQEDGGGYFSQITNLKLYLLD